MAPTTTMPPRPDIDSLRRLQEDIEVFVKSLDHPIVLEDEKELFDLTAAKWRLTLEFGKLLFEAWNPARSIARRVEEIAYRDRSRMSMFVRKPGAAEISTLEFRPLQRAERAGRARKRIRSRQELLGVLTREFPDWRFERVSNRSDREHSFSAWFTRGWARQGRTAWAFLGLSPDEAPAAADAALGFGLIWLDWLRSQSQGVTVSGLKLFLPPEAIELNAHRAAYLDARAAQVDVFEWQESGVRAVDLKDFGNVQTKLAPRCQGEALVERHREIIRKWLEDLVEGVDVVPDASGAFLSLRAAGLEIGRVEGQLAPRIYWGLEGNYQRLEEGNRTESRNFVQQVIELRAPQSEDPSHPYFRLQSERWLESVLVRDLTRIDPALSPCHVYPQVPAFSGMERGVIDILSVTRPGRLAVIELKLDEEINLPLQGLDYWLRVKWLQERGQFQAAGYFPEVMLASAPPILYLVAPAFRFHSSIYRLLRYFHPSIEVIKIGLNDGWRKEIKVLFRRDARGAS